MKPYEEKLIWAITGFLCIATLLVAVITPEGAWELNPLFWLILMGLCFAGIGWAWELAERRKNKPLRWLAALPAAVLAYAGWFFLKLLALGIWRERRTFFYLAWIALTIYLWVRGSEYKKDEQNAQELLRRQEVQRQRTSCPHCGAQL